jgi:hypothetical protein
MLFFIVSPQANETEVKTVGEGGERKQKCKLTINYHLHGSIKIKQKWRLLQMLTKLLMIYWHPFCSHELQSFSDLMIAFRFINERTKWFPGNCLDHVSGFPPFSSNNTSRRHIGHLKPVDLSPFTDDVIEAYCEACENWHKSLKVALNTIK